MINQPLITDLLVLALPVVKSLPGNPKVPAGLRNIPSNLSILENSLLALSISLGFRQPVPPASANLTSSMNVLTKVGSFALR